MTLQNTLMYSFWKFKADKIYSIVLEEFRLNWIQLACFAFWAESPWNLSFSFVSWSVISFFSSCVLFLMVTRCPPAVLMKWIESSNKFKKAIPQQPDMLYFYVGYLEKITKMFILVCLVTSGRLLITSLAFAWNIPPLITKFYFEMSVIVSSMIIRAYCNKIYKSRLTNWLKNPLQNRNYSK